MTRQGCRLHVLIGLPGSGKTTFLKQRFQIEHPEVIVFDDYQANAIVDLPDPQWSRNRADAIEALRSGRDVLVSDVNYCRSAVLERLVDLMRIDVPGVEVELIYFANDPASAIHNVRLRGREGHLREIELIRDLSKGYAPPRDAMQIVRGTPFTNHAQ